MRYQIWAWVRANIPHLVIAGSLATCLQSLLMPAGFSVTCSIAGSSEGAPTLAGHGEARTVARDEARASPTTGNDNAPWASPKMTMPPARADHPIAGNSEAGRHRRL